jgi:predicted nuclease of predicted toxin-antitoxin system
MRFKLDENLPVDVASLLRDAGHDAHTVNQEELCGAPDEKISAICREEQRTLITLDTDFCNILNYPPAEYAGIIVIRAMDQSKPSVLGFIEQIIMAIQQEEVHRKLWIVQKDGIRIRQSPKT